MTGNIPYAIVTARIDGSYDISLDKGIGIIIYKEREDGGKEIVARGKE
jgi:hypothetical protein